MSELKKGKAMRIRELVGMLVLLASILPSLGEAATLDRIKERGAIRLAVREDAAPFSFKEANGEYAGYTVGLCRLIAIDIARQLRVAEVKIEYVPVTASNRFETVAAGRADLLCGATTVTLERRRQVDFSVPTFVDGAGVMFRAGGPSDFKSLGGHIVGVRRGTTTERSLSDAFRQEGINANVVPVDSHDDGLRRLEAGEFTAYFADRAILQFLMFRKDAGQKLLLADQYFTHEPYALALARGDGDFRLAVDGAISRIFRSDALDRLFRASFGDAAKPSPILRTMFLMSTLPD
ncbi:MAG TPA: amino acid ABC transporter substrate-binding protein [Alphaproteobacteria bacterium]|nr:amino acid ABC transporter substrate-binding protein [Alphaproteobacteria bacterium]